jgi:hypothetical protein
VAAGGTDVGALALYLSLIGKAETAQMTVTLTLPARPTFVSSASISVRRLDYREIYRALQHVGLEAAQRLNAKLRAAEALASAEEPAPRRTPGDPELRQVFDEAQREKHALRYDEARTLFERVAPADGDHPTALGDMARDELRYGLPAFEAKQSILSKGQPKGETDDKFQSIARAENLYRQIQAENPLRPERVAEAQRALDDLAIARTAIKTAMWSVSVSRMAQLRMAMMEFLMVEGSCPDDGFVAQVLDGLPYPLELTALAHEAKGPARYAVMDPSTDVEVQLVCDRDVRIENPPARIR